MSVEQQVHSARGLHSEYSFSVNSIRFLSIRRAFLLSHLGRGGPFILPEGRFPGSGDNIYLGSSEVYTLVFDI